MKFYHLDREFDGIIADLKERNNNGNNGGLAKMKIKGVNLGNWLVLEKWMNPAFV